MARRHKGQRIGRFFLYDAAVRRPRKERRAYGNITGVCVPPIFEPWAIHDEAHSKIKDVAYSLGEGMEGRVRLEDDDGSSP